MEAHLLSGLSKVGVKKLQLCDHAILFGNSIAAAKHSLKWGLPELNYPMQSVVFSAEYEYKNKMT